MLTLVMEGEGREHRRDVNEASSSQIWCKRNVGRETSDRWERVPKNHRAEAEPPWSHYHHQHHKRKLRVDVTRGFADYHQKQTEAVWLQGASSIHVRREAEQDCPKTVPDPGFSPMWRDGTREMLLSLSRPFRLTSPCRATTRAAYLKEIRQRLPVRGDPNGFPRSHHNLLVMWK
jgi:hypothetical protein